MKIKKLKKDDFYVLCRHLDLVFIKGVPVPVACPQTKKATWYIKLGYKFGGRKNNNNYNFFYVARWPILQNAAKKLCWRTHPETCNWHCREPDWGYDRCRHLQHKFVISTVGSQTEVMTGVAICNTNLSESATKQSPCTELILVECVLFMLYQRWGAQGRNKKQTKNGWMLSPSHLIKFFGIVHKKRCYQKICLFRDFST